VGGATVTLSPTTTATNVALGKPTAQSSTLGVDFSSKAVDGNVDGDYSHGSVTQTGYDTNAWWQVDLGSQFAINSIQI